jgi:hypothetical protein
MLLVTGVASAGPASAAAVSVECTGDSQGLSVAVGEKVTITASHCTIVSAVGVGVFSPSDGYVFSDVTFSSAVAGTAVLTIDAGISSSMVDAAFVDPTVVTITVVSGSTSPPPAAMTFDGNGGDCTVNPLVRTGRLGETYALPSATECTRAGFTLDGWAFSPDATKPADPNTKAGAVVTFADSGTMYAVWRPVGVQVTYDANVADGDMCLDPAGNEVVPGLGRVATSLESRSLATAVPCRPADPALALAGWAVRGDGPVAYGLGVPLVDTDLITGSSARLYAVWLPPLQIRCAQGRGLPLATFDCTDYGTVPVGREAILEVRITNQGSKPRTLVPRPWAPTVGGNGTVTLVPMTGDCGPETTVPGRGSCTIHVSWISAQPGSLGSVPLVVCLDGDARACYRPSSTQQLRGTAVGAPNVGIATPRLAALGG